MGAGGLPLAAISDVAAAAPIAFCVGFVVGLLFANRWIIARRRDWRLVPREHYHRDYSNERGPNGA